MTLLQDVERYIAFRQKLGSKMTTKAGLLTAFAVFAERRGDRHIRIDSALAWSMSASSARQKSIRLHAVRQLAAWLRAEDPCHEMPHRDAAGRFRIKRRSARHLLTPEQIRKVMDAALQPTSSLSRYTYHYSIGLMAATGLRPAEVCALKLTDLRSDGLLIGNAKFGKSRLVALHPTTRMALQRYLEIRFPENVSDDHLFVLANGNALSPNRLYCEFVRLTRRLGLRGAPGQPGTRLHDLRHAFAVRSLEAAIATDQDRVSRHILALSTYLGHVELSSTYWYLEATPALLRQIADAAQSAAERERGES